MFDLASRERPPADPRVFYWVGGTLTFVNLLQLIVRGIEAAQHLWTLPLGLVWLATGFEHRRRGGVTPVASRALSMACLALAIASLAWVIYRN